MFILGLILGFFYKMIALRIPTGHSEINPSLQCSSCQVRLGIYDIIPVLSYVASRGRCGHCGARKSAQYPFVELATGLMFVWTFHCFGFSASCIAGIVLVSLGVIVTVTDLNYMKIPNQVLLAFLPLLLVITIFFPWQGFLSSLLGAAVGLGITLLIAVLTDGMGMGDVKLFALLGWIVGLPQVILAFFIACVLGSLIGGGLIISGKIASKQRIPFAPWLAIGAWVAFAYGEQMMAGYLLLIK